jgi:RNA polymerase-binding transcription factor DksA
MTNELTQENKKKLEAERSRLRGILSRGNSKDGQGEFPGDYKPSFPEIGREEGENASEVEQFANNLAVTQDLEARLGKIEAALKRIEEGTYGKCAEGDDIEEDRLRAVPEADRCIKHSK